MILKNREGLVEYNISEDWYKNRKPGISAILRAYKEERWIGACLESILPFFDEIVLSTDGSDKTAEIANSFNSKKIKILPDYPFKIGNFYKESFKDTIHDFAYYTNWVLSKTTHQMVCRWDADMIMLPDFYKEYNFVLNKNVVRIFGCNLVNIDPPLLSKGNPYAGYEPRFFKIKKFMYFVRDDEEFWRTIYIDDVEKHEMYMYELASSIKKIMPFEKRNDIEKIAFFYRLFNFFGNKDIYYGANWIYCLRNYISALAQPKKSRTHTKKGLPRKKENYSITYDKFKPAFIHTKLLKISNKDMVKASTSIEDHLVIQNDADYKEWLECGNMINFELPKSMFKKPEDYL